MPRILSIPAVILLMLGLAVVLAHHLGVVADSHEDQVTDHYEKQFSDEQKQIVSNLASLLDSAKLDILNGKRASTPRLRKASYWLIQADYAMLDPVDAIERAYEENGATNEERSKESKAALLRNITILDRLGCSNLEGLEKLRRGNAPTIAKGPYVGEVATVDHIIPRSVCPEQDNKLFNLEFMPETLNQRKGAKVGDWQRQLAKKWAFGEGFGFADLKSKTRFRVDTPAVIAMELQPDSIVFCTGYADALGEAGEIAESFKVRRRVADLKTLLRAVRIYAPKRD